MRSTNEKITDGARNLFEKVTGYVFIFLLLLIVIEDTVADLHCAL